MSKTDILKEMIAESHCICVLTGAGISTESGIPDFRSENGLYKTKQEYGAAPEVILSRTFFDEYPDIFYDYYKKNFLVTEAQPNRAHRALAELERRYKLYCIATQNVDGLHTKAGNKYVYELHGSIYRNHCMKCKKEYPVEYIIKSQGVPKCSCGGIIKPDVLLYEEPLNGELMDIVVNKVIQADMMIVCGTSLNVYPAASFPYYYKGSRLVIINKSETQLDGEADLVIHESLGDVLGEAVDVE